MPKKKITIDERIERKEKQLFMLKDKCKAVEQELEDLLRKRDEEKIQELIDAVQKSSISIDDMIAYVKRHKGSTDIPDVETDESEFCE